MYICICHALTEKDLLQTIEEKDITNVRSLGRETGACRQCGKCAPDARNLISSHLCKQKRTRQAA